MPPVQITEIRAAVPANAAMIRALVRAAYARWVPILGREPLPMNADYQRAVQEHQIDVLYVDGRMMGLIEMIIYPDHLWIENVAITPESQGKGFGRQLLDHAERRAARAGCPEIRLLTNAAFEANVALYRAIGYDIDRQEAFMGGTTVYMRKRIGE